MHEERWGKTANKSRIKQLQTPQNYFHSGNPLNISDREQVQDHMQDKSKRWNNGPKKKQGKHLNTNGFHTG